MKVTLFLFFVATLLCVVPVAFSATDMDSKVADVTPLQEATESVPVPVLVGNTICPVSGEAINEEAKATYEYEGKVYNFCCAACIDDFKKDPQSYIKKMQGQGLPQSYPPADSMIAPTKSAHKH